MSIDVQSSFWTRNNLSDGDADECIRAVRSLYRGYHVQQLEDQGYCSFTLLLTPRDEVLHLQGEPVHDGSQLLESRGLRDLIVQIRPAQHGLNLSMAQSAEKMYLSLAPKLRVVDIQLPGQLSIYEMDKLQGTPLSRILPKTRCLPPSAQAKQINLISSLATFVEKTWYFVRSSSPSSRNLRADSPISDTPTLFPQCTGKVGSSIVSRLELLARNLPDEPLRQRARQTLFRVKEMYGWPIVLTHGDLIPSNILVDEETWEITGVVDWAEAEYLPFGVCLYGLEHVLGYKATEGNGRGFVYYDNAARLRECFWECVVNDIPELVERKEDVMIWRDVGVLLWNGIAWDEGKINRVINEVDHVEELVYLRAFLEMK